MATSPTSGSAAPASGGGGLAIDPVSAAVSVGTAIAGTIASISDMKKRREFEQALALLSNKQRQNLEEKLLAANTQTERLQILSNNLIQYMVGIQTSTAKKDMILYAIAGTMAIALLIILVIYKKKSD